MSYGWGKDAHALAQATYARQDDDPDTPAESICRKLMVPAHPADQHYFDLDDGVIDSWISLTEDEKAYLRSLLDDEPDADVPVGT